ncbi:hypothetical protein EWM60_01115 [Candidatus Erwinia dacicola]|nr:hypothetical protein [Candidatus Erwinia dacicola]
MCCEADEQWSYVRCKGNQRWLFYACDTHPKASP